MQRQHARGVEYALALAVEGFAEEALGNAGGVGGINEHCVVEARRSRADKFRTIGVMQVDAWVGKPSGNGGEVGLRNGNDAGVDLYEVNVLDRGMAENFADRSAIAAADDKHSSRGR